MRLRRPKKPYWFKPEVRIRMEELASKVVDRFIEKWFKEVFCKPIRFEKIYIWFSIQYREWENIVDKLYVYRDSQEGIKWRLNSEYNAHFYWSEITFIDSYYDIVNINI